MTRDDMYDILDVYLIRCTDSSFIRVYADSVSVSAYINGKQIHIEGDYSIVSSIVRGLSWDFKR